MAAQVLLLLLLLCNIHAQVIQRVGRTHHFPLNRRVNFCSVTRWTGERKELLWESFGAPFKIDSLNFSDSGQYQEQCWHAGSMTLERNSILLVCGDQKMKDHQRMHLNIGQTVELTCDGVGPNQSVQWAYETSRTQEFVLIDEKTPSAQKHQLVKNKPSLLLTADRPSADMVIYCLEKEQHRCDLHSRFSFQVQPEFILRLVGESLELNCSDGTGDQTHMWRMDNYLQYQSWADRMRLNSVLMLPSLTLGHSGNYRCEPSVSAPEVYVLFVCPEPEPPAVVLFTVGENLTLHCGDWNLTDWVQWFMRSNRTKGRVFNVTYQRPNNMYPTDTSLVIINVSLQDSGQFWCVAHIGHLCVFRSETSVMLREPEVDHRLVRSALLSVVWVVMLCVVAVVVVMVWRRRKREPLPAPVEELEMSQLSPETDVQE